MNALTQTNQPDSIPLLRKLLMPPFVLIAAVSGLALSGWAIGDSIVGLTTGEWLVDTLAFKADMIVYAVSGILSFVAGIGWFVRMILLRSRRQRVFTDRLLTRLFVITVISFVVMNVVHILSEVLICAAGIAAECSF